MKTSDRMLALTCILLALAALAVWVPNDIESGIVEKVRRRVSIGDSLLPTLAIGFVVFGGIMVLVFDNGDAPVISLKDFGFLCELLLCLAVSFAAMQWLGPLAVALSGEEAGYRILRDTAPWKHIGFVLGGTALVAGIMMLGERHLSLRGVMIGLAATLALIAIYDLPFDDLLLPPNGDF